MIWNKILIWRKFALAKCYVAMSIMQLKHPINVNSSEYTPNKLQGVKKCFSNINFDFLSKNIFGSAL